MGAGKSKGCAEEQKRMLDLTEAPSFCAHEHWGSMNALGMDDNGYCSDTRAGSVTGATIALPISFFNFSALCSGMLNA